MTREEAERIAARLVTVAPFGGDYSVRVAGRPVGHLVDGVAINDRTRFRLEAREGREMALVVQRAWRDAIVCTLTEEG